MILLILSAKLDMDVFQIPETRRKWSKTMKMAQNHICLLKLVEQDLFWKPGPDPRPLPLFENRTDAFDICAAFTLRILY